MTNIIWQILFLTVLSLPNITALWFDPTSTKLAGLIVPILFFIGLGRLVKKLKYRLLLFIPFFVLSYMDLVYLIQFNVQTTAGLIGSIVETNIREGSELMKDLPRSIYWTLFVYTGVFLLLYFTLKKTQTERNSYNKIITWLLILLPLIDLLGKGASSRSYPLGVSRAIFVYSRDIAVSNRLIGQRQNFSFNASLNGDKGDDNYIFVIGETSRRDFYSIYGYSRQTNPRLSKYKSLAVFSDAISPSNATIPSLKSMLYMATPGDESLFYSSKSIVSLARESGYETYWLSSQSRFGEFDATSGSTGIEAKNTIFINQERAISRVYDGELLPYLKDSLDDGNPNKFIVVHLYGSHLAYDRRYPEGYDIFKDTPPKYENRSESVQRKVNEYGNSIVYTDFVLSQIIDTVAIQNKSSCVVYTSDHGEYLADAINDEFTGHGYPIPHKPETEVPLLVWCSQEYRDTHPKKWESIWKNQNLKISNEDIFYTLADLLRIDFKLMKPERSFFNDFYKPLDFRKVKSASNKKLFNYSELK